MFYQMNLSIKPDLLKYKELLCTPSKRSRKNTKLTSRFLWISISVSFYSNGFLIFKMTNSKPILKVQKSQNDTLKCPIILHKIAMKRFFHHAEQT